MVKAQLTWCRHLHRRESLHLLHSMVTTKVDEPPHDLQSLLVGDIIRWRILARIAMTVTVAVTAAMSPLLF
jgi:hypothetical protein